MYIFTDGSLLAVSLAGIAAHSATLRRSSCPEFSGNGNPQARPFSREAASAGASGGTSCQKPIDPSRAVVSRGLLIPVASSERINFGPTGGCTCDMRGTETRVRVRRRVSPQPSTRRERDATTQRETQTQRSAMRRDEGHRGSRRFRAEIRTVRLGGLAPLPALRTCWRDLPADRGSHESTPPRRGQHVRHGHRMRGKPPTIARTLKQRLEELNCEDPTLDFKVNIGYPVPKVTRRSITSAWTNEIIARRNDAELERASRSRKLLVDLQSVREDWLRTDGHSHIHRLARHYGVYNDLYGDAYFMPTVPLNVNYELENVKQMRVYTGNVIKPNEASKAPDVTYNAEDGSLWTLVMSTPDGNLTNADEYCHWFIGNIPGNRLKEGEELVDYLQPIAPYGIGYCRYIFVLYKQEHRIDFSEYKRAKPCLKLEERDWRTLDFYRKHQDQLTPTGLAFFQSDWDSSLKEFYYNTLKTRIPIFRYDFPEPYIKKQKWFPLNEPFNIYLDKYRDPKQIRKEFLLRKLKKVHPFNGPEPSKKFPLAHRNDKYIPSWLKFEIIKKRLGYGRVNDLKEY